MTSRVSAVEVINPPITTVASGRCTSAPMLVAMAIGRNPTLATKAVINTGLRRSIAPSMGAEVQRPLATVVIGEGLFGLKDFDVDLYLLKRGGIARIHALCDDLRDVLYRRQTLTGECRNFFGEHEFIEQDLRFGDEVEFDFTQPSSCTLDSSFRRELSSFALGWPFHWLIEREDSLCNGEPI